MNYQEYERRRNESDAQQILEIKNLGSVEPEKMEETFLDIQKRARERLIELWKEYKESVDIA